MKYIPSKFKCLWCGYRFDADELEDRRPEAIIDYDQLNTQKCPCCGKRDGVDYDEPSADWNDAFEKLREIADKADQLAGDIEETWEYHDKWNEEHDLAIVTVRELTTIMQKAAQMADEIALTMERKELEKKRVG